MSKELTVIHKEFESAFLVDESKLFRIAEIIEQGHKDSNIECVPKYRVFFKTRKTIITSSLDEVFKLDNTLRTPIKRLIIDSTINNEDIGTYLVFDNLSHSGRSPSIHLQVGQSDNKWVNQHYAELEEQIERTLINNWASRLRNKQTEILFATTCLIGIGILLFVIFTTRTDEIGLGQREAASILEKYNDSNTNDEKINFLYEYNKLRIQRALERPAFRMFSNSNLRLLFIFLPLLIIIGCLYYLYKYCYPLAVFEWGDMKNHYQKLITRRNIMWTVVIISFITGVISNFFVLALSHSL